MGVGVIFVGATSATGLAYNFPREQKKGLRCFIQRILRLSLLIENTKYTIPIRSTPTKDTTCEVKLTIVV